MDNARAFFKENGFYLAKGVFPPDKIAELEGEFDRIVAQLGKYGEDTLSRGLIGTRNVHQYSGIWMSTLLDSRFLDVAELFLGPDIVLNHSTLFEKRKSDNKTSFFMHQDWSYLPTQTNTMIAGMIHLGPATVENGCLRVFPNSHKHGRIENSRESNEDLKQRYPFEESTPIVAEPGDVTFFDYFIVHGSETSRSDIPRKVVIVRMFSGKDKKEDLYQYCENIVLRGWNYHTKASTARKVVLCPEDDKPVG